MHDQSRSVLPRHAVSRSTLTPESVRHKTITITIRTPVRGHPHEFAFAPQRSDREGHPKSLSLISPRLANSLPGDCGLAVIRHGRAEDVAEGARLEY